MTENMSRVMGAQMVSFMLACDVTKCLNKARSKVLEDKTKETNFLLCQSTSCIFLQCVVHRLNSNMCTTL